MTRFTSIGASAALIVGIPLLGIAASAQSFDLGADWTDGVNPSANGAWQYGSMNSSHVFTKFTASANDTLTGAFGNAQFRWDGGFPLTMFKVAPGQSSSLDSGGPGHVGGHTANDSNTFLAAQWTSPSAGTIDVSGDVWMWRNIGRTNTVSLFHNGVATFADVVIPTNPPTTSSSPFLLSAAAVAPGDLQNIPVLAGDTITLGLRKTAASPFGDLSGIDYRIQLTSATPEPGSLGLCGSLVMAGAAFWKTRRRRR